ncbi:MAG: TolC family protein [Bradymonadaceae bacterium]
MRRHSIYYLLFLFVAIAPALTASKVAAQTPHVLTLQEALELAGRHSQQIRQSRAEVEKSRLSVNEARAGRLPTVGLDGRYTNNLASPVIVLPEGSPFGTVLRTGARHNFNASAQATIPVYNARLNRSIGLSRVVEELETSLHESTVREVEIEVQRAFLNGLLTRESFAVLQRSHETLQRNLELVEALYAEGMAPEYDMIRTEVQVRNVEPELARAENNHEGALNYLKLITGVPIHEDVVLAGTLEELHASLPTAVFESDFERNRQLIQLEAQHEIAEHQIGLERATYLPTLSAFGNFTYQGQGETLAVWDYPWSHSSAVGLVLSIPIFSGGRRERVERAEIERHQVQMQQEFLSESLQSEFETTLSRIEQLEATIAAQERNIAQAERGFEIARTSYEQGVHSLLDVNDAEAALTNARLNYAISLADYINAMLDMEDLVGNPQLTSNTGVQQRP